MGLTQCPAHTLGTAAPPMERSRSRMFTQHTYGRTYVYFHRLDIIDRHALFISIICVITRTEGRTVEDTTQGHAPRLLGWAGRRRPSLSRAAGSMGRVCPISGSRPRPVLGAEPSCWKGLVFKSRPACKGAVSVPGPWGLRSARAGRRVGAVSARAADL